ncbi:hypothetical protein FRC12_011471 [Ceratobasidium sp. 428]|nr:hypothetical protein FRC12_011471 [Ceratobasidium sp. 428]
MTSKVSFTVRPPPRPTVDMDDTPDPSRPGSASPDSEGLRLPHRPATSSPLVPTTDRNGSSSRPSKRQWVSYTGPDSSDEDEPDTQEMITGFDAMGVQRCVILPVEQNTISLNSPPAFHYAYYRLDESKNKPQGPLVIVPQKNRDWRAESMAKKRQAMNGYVPDGARVAVGKDGSQGGLGTRGAINDGPQLSGLVVKDRVKQEEGEEVKVEEDVEMRDDVKEEQAKGEEEMDEDQRALQAVLRGEQGEENKREIAAIKVEDEQAWYQQSKSEADAFKEDLAARPDEASLADYERVPIELFGEAMLRGMGHVPGKSTSRTGSKQIQPYIPESRPALLGIGAKPRPVDENDVGKKKFTKPDKRYVPLVKVERTNSGSGANSRRTSRSRSGSPPRERKRDKERDRDYDRNRTRDRDDYRDRDRERDRDRDDRRDRRERGYDSERTREKDRDRDRDRERRREYDSDRDYERRRDRDRRDRDDDRREKRR